jgi:excisionase family DNA binding protein
MAKAEVQNTPEEQDYLTKDQVADSLQCSLRTVDTLVQNGTLHTSPMKRPGKRPQPVFDPAEVEQERLNRQTKAVLTSGPSPQAGEVMQTISQSTALATLQTMQETLGSHHQEPRPFCTIREASQASGLWQRYLHEMIEAGKLPVYRQGRMTKVRYADVLSLEGQRLKKRQ